MVKNNHQQTTPPVAELEDNLLGQEFDLSESLSIIDEYKQVAKIYATQENSIAVLSDLKNNRSYIYHGALASALGLSSGGAMEEIESIWEKEIYDRVHPDDLAARHLLELHFFHLLRKTPVDQRSNYRTHSVIRMKNAQGSYVAVLHRTFYQQSLENGALWLALCLYNFPTDIDLRQTIGGLIQNTATGEIIRPNQESADAILSLRERQVLSLIQQGLLSKEIALHLGVSKNTIDRHRQNILEKLRVNNSIEAIKVARALGVHFE